MVIKTLNIELDGINWIPYSTVNVPLFDFDKKRKIRSKSRRVRHHNLPIIAFFSGKLNKRNFGPNSILLSFFKSVPSKKYILYEISKL